MAITYSDSKKQEYEAFKKGGGSITFEIDPEDISNPPDFEDYESIKPRLDSGFELRPQTLIDTPELLALIQAHGSTWDYILCRVYLAGGSVIYKKLKSGKYAATCTIPAT